MIYNILIYFHFCDEPDETSASITDINVNVINKLNLNLPNMVAYGSDDTLVHYGCYCSVFQKLKPSVIKSNCNCHVVHNTLYEKIIL